MKHLVLIELDVLFDTRIGTLSKFGDDVAIEVLENGYRSRITDDISAFTKKITNEQFKEAYRNRDKETLKLSRMTNFIFTLRNIVTELETNILDQAGILEDAAIFNKVSEANQSYEAFAEQIAKDLLDADKQKIYLHFLEKTGFKI